MELGEDNSRITECMSRTDCSLFTSFGLWTVINQGANHMTPTGIIMWSIIRIKLLPVTASRRRPVYTKCSLLVSQGTMGLLSSEWGTLSVLNNLPHTNYQLINSYSCYF